MKKLFIITGVIFFFYCCNNLTDNKKTGTSKGDVQEYFNEVVTNTEFDTSNHTISKWEKDVRIFVKGTKKQDLMVELDSIVSELNLLIDPIDIKIVNKESDANLVLFFGSPEGFTKLYPNLKPYMEENWGLFEIFGSEEITSGRIFVDIVRCKSSTGQKHVLREELTQSLGFCNDSYSYPESIFYQDWSETNEYAQIDKEIIKMLYNK
jgi:hypothetical protein